MTVLHIKPRRNLLGQWYARVKLNDPQLYTLLRDKEVIVVVHGVMKEPEMEPVGKGGQDAR